MLATLWFVHPLFLVHTWGEYWPRWQFHNLLFDNHEKLHYVIRLSEFDDALRTGQWYVRWCNNLCGGYGYPFFNFYAPLAYYFTEPFLTLTGNLFAAWKFQFYFMALAGSFGVFLYSRIFLSGAAAWFAAFLFLLSPYHIANLYVRGNVAEFTAMSVLPFVFWSYHRLLQRPQRRAFLTAAFLSLSALVLSHNVTAMFGTGFLILYIAAVSFSSRTWRALAACTIALIGALAATAFFWLPAIYEMRYCRQGEMQQSFQDTWTHAIYWRQFCRNNWGFGLSLPGPGDDLPFGIGPVHLLLSLLAGAHASRNLRLRRFVMCLTGALLLLLFVMSNWCWWLWQFPLIRAVQFPWRLLSLAAFASSVLAASAIDVTPRWIRLALLYGGGAALILWSAPRLSVSGYFTMPSSQYSPGNTRLNYTMTNVGEFLPNWAEPDRLPKPSDRLIRAGDRVLGRFAGEHNTSFEFTLAKDLSSTASAHIFYFPGWQAYKDGKTIMTSPDEDGMITFPISGAGTYLLRFGPSQIRYLATILSGASLFLYILYVVTRARFRQAKA